MSKEVDSPVSTHLPQTADTTSHISVGDAATRLGVSRSKLYRMDRVNGPLRFIRDGWRLYIELSSLQSLLGEGRYAIGPTDTSGEPRTFVDFAHPPNTLARLAAEVPTPSVVGQPSGQRDLVIIPRVPRLAIFYSF